MLLQEHSSCLCRGENGKPFCLAELWPALIVRIHWDFTINAVQRSEIQKIIYFGFAHAPLKFISAPRKDKHFIGQLWQLMIASNVGAWTQAWQASGWFSKSTALSARVSFLSPQPLPVLLLAPFFIVVFDSSFLLFYGPMVGKYGLICAMEIQKIHMVVHIFSGFCFIYGKWVYRGVESLYKLLTTNKVPFDLPTNECKSKYCPS